jgi:hypothetical protein
MACRAWSRRHIGGLATLLAAAVAAVAAIALTGASSQALTSRPGAAGPAFSRQQVAQHILGTQASAVMTAPAQAVLRMVATGTRELSPGLPPNGLPAPGLSGPATGGAGPSKPAFTNVRVNAPSQDSHQPDQTTQSEPSVAVAGSHVAVGYNDSQQTGLLIGRPSPPGR